MGYEYVMQDKSRFLWKLTVLSNCLQRDVVLQWEQPEGEMVAYRYTVVLPLTGIFCFYFL